VTILLLAAFAVFIVKGSYRFTHKPSGRGCRHLKYEAGDGTVKVSKCPYKYSLQRFSRPENLANRCIREFFYISREFIFANSLEIVF